MARAARPRWSLAKFREQDTNSTGLRAAVIELLRPLQHIHGVVAAPEFVVRRSQMTEDRGVALLQC